MKKSGGLLAVLLGLGAFAYWKYQSLSPNEKDNLKEKIKDTKDNFCKSACEFKKSIESKINQASAELKNQSRSNLDESENMYD